ncbi:TlpA family protein disulfide reductase [Streptomyces sp. KR80]|uniref:TlpA family protein disulfide reductase n=1 Tax=Streptomyces sp. KR80 TaxID=3457426 RepID=UPI003FD45C5B
MTKTTAATGFWTGLLCLALAGCAAGKADATGDGLINRIPAAERQDAPDLTGTSLDGKRIRLSDYRGKVVVLNTWASWCGPCRAEARGLERTQRTRQQEGVQVIGVNTRDDQSSARAFEKSFDLSYPSLYDPDGRQLLRLPKGLLNQRIIPFSIVIDRKGKIATVVPNVVSEDQLRTILSPLVQAGRPTDAALR